MRNKRKIGAVVFWMLTVAVAVVIFMFSSEDGEESQQVSQNFLSVIIEYLGSIVSHNVLRKIAHFSEYAALGFSVCGAIYFTFDKNKFYIPLIPCVLYAAGDEIHQYFIPGRACRLFDVFVDSCGSSLGILVFLLILLIAKSVSDRKINKTL